MSNGGSNSQQQQKVTEPAKVPSASSPEPMKTIAVRMIWFKSPTDLPKKSACEAMISSVRSQVLDADGKRIGRNGHAWLVEFIPQIRHHRITYYPADDAPEQSRYVHESCVKGWDPV